MAATLKDVAAPAGVSVQTVSYVVDGAFVARRTAAGSRRRSPPPATGQHRRAQPRRGRTGFVLVCPTSASRTSASWPG